MVLTLYGAEDKCTILVVEDDAETRSGLCQLLTDEGYQVYFAGNGSAAFDEMIRMPRMPDIILLDLMMPVMDGYTVIEILQADDKLGKIPVIVISAHHNTGPIPGTVAVLPKPFELNDLLTTLQQYC